tara:strand:+ start:274 stop:927 length:654 start_codon:yes stop_codon:yes gene_type:complete
MTKDKNIYPMTDLVGSKKIKTELTDEYVTNAPYFGSAKVDFLQGIDQRFLQMGKALITDDIYIQERLAQIKWDVNSSKGQKFWMQSPSYRGVFNYAIKGSLSGTSYAISYIVSKLALTYPTVTKIVNEAEAEGYIYVYNKGDASEKTAIAAVEWLTIDYLKRYIPYRADGWNTVLNDYDTNAFHKWWLNLKADPKKAEAFADQINTAEENAKNKGNS